MEYILTITLIYQSGGLTKVDMFHVDGFKTEKACLSYASMEDKHLKRIKAQTNIKSFELNCYWR